MKRSLLLCLWLLAIHAKGQHSFTLSHLSVDEGLAHNNIYALYQDHEEYIWIGAGPNLHRYDGNQLVTYKHKIDDPNSLPGGDVRSIYQDRKGNLWIGSNSGGLSLFKDGIFKRIEHKYSEASPYLDSSALAFRKLEIFFADVLLMIDQEQKDDVVRLPKNKSSQIKHKIKLGP